MVSPINKIKDRELEILRREIDITDREILRLLERRFDIVRNISRLKKNKKLPIRDIEREREIIRNKCKLTYLTPHVVEKIYGAIIECAREMQGDKIE